MEPFRDVPDQRLVDRAAAVEVLDLGHLEQRHGVLDVVFLGNVRDNLRDHGGLLQVLLIDRGQHIDEVKTARFGDHAADLVEFAADRRVRESQPGFDVRGRDSLNLGRSLRGDLGQQLPLHIIIPGKDAQIALCNLLPQQVVLDEDAAKFEVLEVDLLAT